MKKVYEIERIKTHNIFPLVTIFLKVIKFIAYIFSPVKSNSGMSTSSFFCKFSPAADGFGLSLNKELHEV